MRIRTAQHRAGRSALEVWREQRRQTLRREWRVWTTLLLAIVGLAAGLPFTHGYGELFMAAGLGSLLTMLYVGWELGGDIHSLTWRWGQFGEEETEDALKALDHRWRVIHDLPRGRRNWDHVVVGPAGVFLLETKNYRAAAVVKNDRLAFGRTTSFKGGDFAREAKALYWALDARQRTIVTPVVVIWGEFEQDLVKDDRVVYVSGASLGAWLESLPPKLPPSRVAELADAVERLRPSS